MIAALTYVPRRNPLSRAGVPAASCYLLVFAAIACVFSNPVVLAADALAVVVVGSSAGAGRALAVSLRFAASLGVLMIVTNAIASQRGDTVLVRGPDLPILGTIDISAEAIAEGGILALRVATVIAAGAVFSAAIDPDRVLRLVRPLARRSALTATLVVRLVPLAAADHARLREAGELRGPAAAPVSRPAMLRRLVAGSLERASDAAATLELHGYTGTAPGRARRAPRSPVDFFFWFATSAIAVAATLVIAGQAATYESYPQIDMELSAGALALALSLPIVASLPFVAERVRR